MTSRVPIVGLVLDYRDPVRTRRCVLSLLAAGLEHALIWSNTEGAAGDATTYGFTSDDPVTVLGCSRNLGFAAGVNRGISKCVEIWPSCLVLLVNNDACVAPDVPRALLDALKEDSDSAVAFPAVLQQGSRLGWMWYQPWLAVISPRPIVGAIRYASGCCQLIDPSRTGKAPFDERFFMYGEDVAFAASLARVGLNQVFVASALVEHEGSASSVKGSPTYEALMVAAHFKLTTVLSQGHRLKQIMMTALRMIVLPARALIRALRFRSFVPITAFWRARTFRVCPREKYRGT